MSKTRRTTTLGLVVATVLALLVVTGPSAGVSAARDDRGRTALTFVRKGQIYTSSLLGLRLRKLTFAGRNTHPQWSPDGTRIAFVRESSAGLRDIWVMRADGSNKQRVTRLGDTTEPTWSPDGQWLAFGANGTPPISTSGQALRRVSAIAPFGEPEILTGIDPADPGDDPRVVDSLAWSPDGRSIAFYSDSFPASPDHFLLVYDLATGAIDFVTGIGGACCGEGFLDDVTWTPDSSAIAYTEFRHPIEDPPPAGTVITVTEWPSRAARPFLSVAGDADPDYSSNGSHVVLSNDHKILVAAADGSQRHPVTRGKQPDWRPGVPG